MRNRVLSTILVPIAFLALAPLASASPSLSIQGVFPGTSIQPGQTVTFFAAANGFFNNASFSVDGGGSIDSDGNYTWTPTVDDAGSHTITVTATDSINNTATASVQIFVVPGEISLQNLEPGATAYTNEPVTFSVSAPGYTNPVYAVRDSYAGSSVVATDMSSDGQFSWSPKANEQGTHTLIITASDAYGHTGQLTQQITVMPPQLQIVNVSPGPSVLVGTPVTFSASSTGLTSPVTYSVTDSQGRYSTVNASSTDADGNFSWTPGSSDVGTHNLTLNATDANGSSVSSTIAITVGSNTTTIAPTSIVTPPAGSTGETQTVVPTQTQTPTSTQTTTSVGDGYVFTHSLSVGSTGTAVTELQKRLTALGVYNGPITGYYGSMTEAGVKAFQSSRGIVSSGSPSTTGYGAFGPKTRTALNAASSGSVATGSGSTTAPQSLNGLSFVLSSANGAVLPTGETYTLSFNGGQVQAKFCNSMSGSYAISGATLSATMMSTLMYCSVPTDVMPLEDTFKSVLSKGATYALSGNLLILVGSDGSSMVFTKSAGQ